MRMGGKHFCFVFTEKIYFRKFFLQVRFFGRRCHNKTALKIVFIKNDYVFQIKGFLSLFLFHPLSCRLQIQLINR